MSDRHQRPEDAPETDSERRWTNLLIIGFLVLIVGGGIWLVNAMLEVRQLDDCVAAGRRNCAPIEVPAQR
jgi:hypothetical protein